MNTKTKAPVELAVIVEVTPDLVNRRTGDDQSLTRLLTLDGEFIDIWDSHNTIHGKQHEEVYVATRDTTRKQPDGTEIPWKEYSIVPTAFAEKILGINQPKKAVRRTRKSK